MPTRLAMAAGVGSCRFEKNRGRSEGGSGRSALPGVTAVHGESPRPLQDKAPEKNSILNALGASGLCVVGGVHAHIKPYGLSR